jgi:large repetitive protein
VGGRTLPLVLLVAACATPGPPPSPPPASGAPSSQAVDAGGAAAVPPEPEPARGEPDRDHDRIPDSQDKCPDEPETYNGFQDSDGCPDRGVSWGPWKVEILEKIYFAPGSRAPEPGMAPLIDAVAAALKANPRLAVVRIEGHASGEERNPVRLARARATAVRDALVERGVLPGRLRTQGHGVTRLLCATRSEECRHMNRRVEFSILEIAPPAAPPAPAEPLEPGTAGDAAGTAIFHEK